jgi:type I restriction enzyme, S subunit
MREVALGSVCDIKNGYAFKSTEFKDEGVPLLRISSFDNGPVYFDDRTVYVDEEYLETKSTFKVEKGDVLIALSGATTGKYGLYTSDEPSLLNQRIGLLKSGASKELDDKYFYFYLSVLQSEILRKAGGAAQPNISTKAIGELKIPLPPLDQQKQIASILDTADTYRQKTKALIDKYDALTQSLFLEMFGDKKKFERVQLQSVVANKKDFVDGPFGSNLKVSDQTQEGVRLIQINNIGVGEFRDKVQRYTSEKKYQDIIRHNVKAGDIVVAKMGEPLGRACLVPEFINKGLVVADCMRIRVNLDMWSNLFVMFFLNSIDAKQQINNLSHGSTRVRINLTMLRQLEIPHPTVSLQNQFAERVKAIEAQKALAQQELDKADNLFNSLLQKAFKGELV